MGSLENDMKLLLDALQYLSDDKEQQIQALKTLANMCNEKEGAIHMYKNGGLKSITTIFCNTQSTDVKQWALYALSNAVQYYKPNKKLLCIPEMMKKIHAILGTKKSNYLVHVAANFILSLASDYEPAQEMARTEKCLHRLLEIYRESMPRSDVWFDGVGTSSDELWMIVSSALCILMSDPQNVKNQNLCSKVFPQAICMLKNARSNVQFTALNFIGHCISNNKETQRTLQLVGGLHALVILLKNYSDTDGENEARVLATVLKTISYAVTDFPANKEAVGSLSIITVLLNLLQKQNISPCLLSSCLICLSRCVDGCVSNRATLFKNNGVQKLISILIAAEDEETRKIVLYLLRGCMASPLQGQMEISDKELLSKIMQSGGANFQLRDTNTNDTTNIIIENSVQSLNKDDLRNNSLRNYNSSRVMQEKLVSSIIHSVPNHIAGTNKRDFPQGMHTAIAANESQIGCHRYTLGTPLSTRSLKVTESEYGRILSDQSKDLINVPKANMRQGEAIDQSNLDNRELNDLMQRINDPRSVGPSITPRDSEIGIAPSHMINRQDPSVSHLQSYDTQKDDKIMKILDQHGKLLHSVNKRIDDLKFDNNSVISGYTTETLSTKENNYTIRPYSGPKNLESSNCQSVHQNVCPINNINPDVHANDKEFALLNALKLQDASTVEERTNLSSMCQQSNITPCKRTTATSENALFKVPSQNKGIFSSQKASKKLVRQDSVSKKRSEVSSVFGIRDNLKEQEISISEAIGRKSLDRNDNAESLSRHLENTPKNIIRYQSSERSPNNDTFNVDTHSDTIRITITPGARRQVQHSMNGSVQSESSMSKSNPMHLEKSTRQPHKKEYRSNVSKDRCTSALSMRTRSTTQGPLMQDRLKKYEMTQKNGLSNKSTSDWVNKTSSYYGVEDDDPTSETTSCDNQNPLDIQHATSIKEQYKTPVPPTTTEENMNSRSSSTSQYYKTPANFIPTRLAKVAKKVKRVVAFNNECPETDEESSESIDKGEGSLQSSCSSIGRAASPSILPPDARDDTQLKIAQAPQKQSNCLGCYPFSRFPFFVVNSRNFASALQNDDQTCEFHKNLIKDKKSDKIQHDLQKNLNTDSAIESGKSTAKETNPTSKGTQRNNVNIETSGFDFMSDSGKEDDMLTDVSSLVSCHTPCSEQATTVMSKRRKRKDYTEEEVENILLGVERHGKRWNAILHSFKFKKGRTAEDLKDKYKRICGATEMGKKKSRKIVKNTAHPKPFTAQEIVNLKTGFGRYGARWKAILNSFQFQKGRNAEELRVKYENVFKKF